MKSRLDIRWGLMKERVDSRKSRAERLDADVTSVPNSKVAIKQRGIMTNGRIDGALALLSVDAVSWAAYD